MRSKAISVSPEQGEAVRRRLASEGLLLTDARMKRKEGVLLIPVSDYPEWIPDAQRQEGEFEVRVKGGYRERVDIDEKLRALLPSSFDIIGNKALIKLPHEIESYGEEIGRAIMETHPPVNSVFQDLGVSGPFRIRSVRLLAGDETTETEVSEYGMKFRVDVSKTFFSPRLAEERKRVFEACRRGERVLDMFAGVGPFSISVARKAAEVVALDVNPYAVSYCRENCYLNHINNVRPYLRDAAEFSDGKFDRIIMNLPMTGSDYLENAKYLLEKEGRIDFYSHIHDSALHAKIWELRMRHGLRVLSHRKVKSYSPLSSIYHLELALQN